MLFSTASRHLFSKSLTKTTATAVSRTFMSGTSRVTARTQQRLQSSLSRDLDRRLKLRYGVAGALLLTAVAESLYGGTTKDFYEYRFYLDPDRVDPDDLADFYGSENFMDIFCVMPFMGTLMMRGGYFDDEGTVHTTGLPGEMLVSMVFSDGDDADDDEEGDSKGTKWFNKRERFRDICFGYTCWDMVTNFGFEQQPDGRIMVYHHGEYFSSALPPVSLLVKFVFQTHARWVAWATEHHLSHYAFQNETEFDEHNEKESREDMPLFLLKNYAWTDLMAALWGRKVEKPSFLIKRSQEELAKLATEEDEEEEETEVVPPVAVLTKDESDAVTTAVEEEKILLPVQRPAIMRRITLDIRFDRETSSDEMTESEADQELLSRLQRLPTTIARKSTAANQGGLQRSYTVLAKRNSSTPNLTEEASLQRESLGGNAAWEALRSTNNPAAYKAATMAAKDRSTLRKATIRRAATLKNESKLDEVDQKIVRRATSLLMAKDEPEEAEETEPMARRTTTTVQFKKTKAPKQNDKVDA